MLEIDPGVVKDTLAALSPGEFQVHRAYSSSVWLAVQAHYASPMPSWYLNAGTMVRLLV